MHTLEVFEDFAHPAAVRRETYRFRSSWLASSLRALRDRELVERYRVRLPAQFHPMVFESVAGVWLPIEVAIAHYRAIDALELPARAAFDMGREIQTHAQAAVVQVALRGAKLVGITPWTIFSHFRKLWDRTWSGGDFAIYKAGPKEAELEIVGWSIAPSPYVRHSMRGVLEGATEMFCTRVHVREVARKCVGTSLGYRFSWV
jgi:hypothetical protein